MPECTLVTQRYPTKTTPRQHVQLEVLQKQHDVVVSLKATINLSKQQEPVDHTQLLSRALLAGGGFVSPVPPRRGEGNRVRLLISFFHKVWRLVLTVPG